MRSLVYLGFLSLLAGCGGFRGGIESVPDIGETAPHEHRSPSGWSHEVVLPELTLQLSLNNAVQTYQFEVMLFIIPTYLNFWEEFRNREAGALELSLQVTAHDSSVRLDPRQLALTVDGKEVRPSGVWVNNLQRERQVIDAFVKSRREGPSDHPPPPIPHASEWRDAVTEPVTLRPSERSPRFILIFPLPLLSPEKEFTLDINHAIVESHPSQLPIIRFKSMPWSEGYS